MSNAPFVGIYRSVAGFETFTLPGDSLSVNIQFNPTFGPQNALIYVFMHGQGSAPVSSRLDVTFAGGNYKLLSRKYKTELSATLEVWQGWGFMSEEDGGVSPIIATFDNTTSAAGIFVVGFTGVEIGDQWVSPPAWHFTSSSTQTVQLKTPDPPTPSRITNNSNATIGRVAQNILSIARGATAFNTSNATQILGPTTFGSYTLDMVGSGTLNAAPENYEGYVKGSHSSSAALYVGLSLYAPKFLDAKEGTSPDLDETPEDEMRYKERIATLERELAAMHETQIRDQEDFVSTNRQLTTERDGLSRTLADLQALTTAQIDTLQAELDTVRAELQQTLAALPQVVADAAEQMFQQRLNQLFSDPDALRALLMEHAQQAQAPRDLFGALQSIKAL